MSQQAETRELTPAAQAWRPIETAPLDGRPLLLFARSLRASACIVLVGWWSYDQGWRECAFTPNKPVGVEPSHWMPLPGFPGNHPAPIGEDVRDAVCAAVVEALGDAYDCTRVWDAWSVGTMSEDDFRAVSEDPARVAEIADAAIAAIHAAPPAPVSRAEPIYQWRGSSADAWRDCPKVQYEYVGQGIAEAKPGTYGASWERRIVYLTQSAPNEGGSDTVIADAYRRDFEKACKTVKFNAETFPELADMSPEGAIGWLVVELAARHEKFADSNEGGSEPVAQKIIALLEASAAAWEEMAGNFPDDADASGRMIARANESRGNVERIRAIYAAPQPVAPPAALTDAVDVTIKTIERQLELIAERALGDFLDKRPVVQSLQAHIKRLRAALAASQAEKKGESHA